MNEYINNANQCQQCCVFQESGLSRYIGNQLGILSALPNWSVVVIVAALVAGLTEFTSNTATSSLLLPILGELVSTVQK